MSDSTRLAASALWFALAGAGLPACVASPTTLEEATCPDDGTDLTYDNFGASFVAAYCNECHSDARNGAPRAYRFDSRAEIQQHAERIYVRAAGANVSMPPGPDDPPSIEREQLAEWLACGAP